MLLSKDEMEDMASQLRSDLGLKPDQSLDPLRLKIEGVEILPVTLVKNFDKKLIAFLTGEAAKRWSAMSVPIDASQERWVIVYNNSHEKRRQNVSVLEEIWHILQGHRLTRIVKVGPKHSRTFEADEEHDAYYLAAATMLPREAVDEMLKKKRSADDVGNKYGVSRELVEYRIKRLGYWYLYKNRKVSLT